MLNKVYTIKGIGVVAVEDRKDIFGCSQCAFNDDPVRCQETVNLVDRSCAKEHFHYEAAPKKTANPCQLYDPQKNADSIYHLEHGECHTISIGENTFAIHCLHTIVVLFYFDSCCGEYTYVRSFNKTTAGVASCLAVIEEHVNACEAVLAAENNKIKGEEK